MQGKYKIIWSELIFIEKKWKKNEKNEHLLCTFT